MRMHSYDPACEALAEHFLRDTPQFINLAPKLAWTIQRAVEDWMRLLEEAVGSGEEIGP